MRFSNCAEMFSATSCALRVGLLDLNHVDAGRLAGEGFDLLTELFDLGTALADDDTGLRAMNDHTNLRIVSFNFNLGDTGLLKLFLQEPSELVVRNERIAEYFVPSRTSGNPSLL